MRKAITKSESLSESITSALTGRMALMCSFHLSPKDQGKIREHSLSLRCHTGYHTMLCNRQRPVRLRSGYRRLALGCGVTDSIRGSHSALSNVAVGRSHPLPQNPLLVILTDRGSLDYISLFVFVLFFLQARSYHCYAVVGTDRLCCILQRHMQEPAQLKRERQRLIQMTSTNSNSEY